MLAATLHVYSTKADYFITAGSLSAQSQPGEGARYTNLTTEFTPGIHIRWKDQLHRLSSDFHTCMPCTLPHAHIHITIFIEKE